MENGNFIEKLASQISQNASVKNVYGDPIHTGEKTIIPVARIAYGFGGGYGQGRKKNKHAEADDTSKQANGMSGEGSGGGGGMYARPIGIYEITAAGTRFIPARNIGQLLVGLTVGFLIRGWIYSKLRNKKNS